MHSVRYLVVMSCIYELKDFIARGMFSAFRLPMISIQSDFDVQIQPVFNPSAPYS